MPAGEPFPTAVSALKAQWVCNGAPAFTFGVNVLHRRVQPEPYAASDGNDDEATS